MKFFLSSKFSCLLILILLSSLGIIFLKDIKGNTHNCRFWSIIFSDWQNGYAELMHSQLDSLKMLGNSNPDGWGIGYYLCADSDQILSNIFRGEPNSVIDPRYTHIVDEMISCIHHTGIIHIRRGTSGPIGGIPDPHPFRRFGIYRNFDMLFAHNGYIPTNILLTLINTLCPGYLNQNPPDYNPEYLDSDLFSIFLIEVIDMYPDSSIESCIKLATTKLDSGLGNEPAQLNFVMCNDSCLWALHFAEISPESYTLYYYPDTGVSNIWVVASEPLDTFSSYWQAVPNSTLVRLKPNEPVRFISIYGNQINPTPLNKSIFFYPNPGQNRIKIIYTVKTDSDVEFRFYDAPGRLVDQFRIKNQEPGLYSLLWPGAESMVLPAGSYFCLFKHTDLVISTKLLILH